MARIDLGNFNQIEKKNPRLHTIAKFTYSKYNIKKKPYLQIDMYGTPNRKDSNTVSQAIQLDEEAAKFLFGLLKEVFENIDK